MRSTRIKYSRHVKWIDTQMFNITFLYNCADSKLEIPDKSIAGDRIQQHFRLPLSIQWSKDSEK